MKISRRELFQLAAAVSGVSSVAQERTEIVSQATTEDVEERPYRLLSDVMIEMRDGIKLATDVYLPLTGDKFPVVIERTPYGKTRFSRSEIRLDGSKIERASLAAEFTKRGMAVVYQDCRGRYKSEGSFIKYIHEGEDGFDTYKWILNQEWCNGQLGSMGLSYAAHTQLAAACFNPEGLVTMVLDCGGFANSYQSGIRQGGAFEMKQVTWAHRNAIASPLAIANPIVKTALETEDMKLWFAQMPWKKGHSPLRHHPEYEDYLFEQWRKGTFSDYWKQAGIYAEGFYTTLPDIPVLFVSSWYDAYVASTLQNFRAFTAKGRKAQSQLIMGPWLHGDRNITHSGDVEFGMASSFDNNLGVGWLEYRLDWFAQKFGLETGNTDKAVKLFLMGGGSGKKNIDGRLEHGGEWITGDTYPLENSKIKRLYLASDFGLKASANKKSEFVKYQSDPKNPVPTIGGAITSGKPVMIGGAFNQIERPDFFGTKGNNLPLAARSDVLVFETEILQEDLILVGDIKIKLFVRSDAPDVDFTAKIIDVYPSSEDYPQGFAMNITDGIMRARYRKDWSKPQLLKKDEIAEINIFPFQSCNIFKKGHKLRLDIASSNFPHFDINPQTGEPDGNWNTTRIALNEILCGGKNASYLEISILTNHQGG